VRFVRPLTLHQGYFPCSDTTIGSLLLVVFYGAVLGVGAKVRALRAALFFSLTSLRPHRCVSCVLWSFR
jgi:hypothetical protein